MENKENKAEIERTTLSLSLSVEEKKLLKQYALDKGTTAAAVVQSWINRFCRNEGDTNGRK